jgi:transposase
MPTNNLARRWRTCGRKLTTSPHISDRSQYLPEQGTVASWGRRQSPLAVAYRWPVGFSAQSRNRACHCRLRNELGGADWPLVATSAVIAHASLINLSRDELIALILAQHAQIEVQAQQISTLTARVAELEAKLSTPAKTLDNSSLPPSKGQKSNWPDPARKNPRPSRPGVARALAQHPDTTIEATLDACRHCAHALSPAGQPEIHAYDHIDLPPIRPIITRISRYRDVCPCCRKPVAAPAPAGLEPGSPFGPGIGALIPHLHITQAVSFERLARLMSEVFGLTISEGAIANSLVRAKPVP